VRGVVRRGPASEKPSHRRQRPGSAERLSAGKVEACHDADIELMLRKNPARLLGLEG
jgi:hypothetical protein